MPQQLNRRGFLKTAGGMTVGTIGTMPGTLHAALLRHRELYPGASYNLSV